MPIPYAVHVVDAEIETVIACKCRLGVTARIVNEECAAVSGRTHSSRQ